MSSIIIKEIINGQTVSPFLAEVTKYDNHNIKITLIGWRRKGNHFETKFCSLIKLCEISINIIINISSTDLKTAENNVAAVIKEEKENAEALEKFD